MIVIGLFHHQAGRGSRGQGAAAGLYKLKPNPPFLQWNSKAEQGREAKRAGKKGEEKGPERLCAAKSHFSLPHLPRRIPATPRR